MPIVYCLLARGVVVECDASHPLHSGNFKLVALKLLSKVNQQYDQPGGASVTSTATISPTAKRQTLLFDAHTFNFLSLPASPAPLHCLALCTADVKQHTAFLFLQDVMETYRSGGRGAAGTGAAADISDAAGRLDGASLKALTDALHARMDQYNSSTGGSGAGTGGGGASGHSGGGKPGQLQQQEQQRDKRERDRAKSGSSTSKSSKRPTFSSVSAEAVGDDAGGHTENPDAVHNVKRELESVKDTLLGNIDRVLSRGEALENLVDRSDAVHSSADQFKSASTRLHRHMRWQQIRTTITLVTMAAIIVYFIAASRCGITLKSC